MKGVYCAVRIGFLKQHSLRFVFKGLAVLPLSLGFTRLLL